ncbi:hypothetical protein R1sor_017867 [Riccia sorocarpa]|uniref:NADP-dependent oxidoreductase domain-containing protein n=1 Tax=Riccia sorocarpa TaxID=122646 RepID=A0ABD3IBS7_9MARC
MQITESSERVKVSCSGARDANDRGNYFMGLELENCYSFDHFMYISDEPELYCLQHRVEPSYNASELPYLSFAICATSCDSSAVSITHGEDTDSHYLSPDPRSCGHRRAHAIHPITAVQIEYSFWARDVEEDIIPTCQELGIGIISYSPLGRGFFSGKNITEFTDNDFRKDNLLWLGYNTKELFQFQRQPSLKNLEENIGSLTIKLTPEEIKALEDAVPVEEVKGDRYADMRKTWRFNSSPPLDTWTGTKH